jgi:hypothetical protein
MKKSLEEQLRESIERRYENDSWMKFCKKTNPELYTKEISRILKKENKNYFISKKKNKFLGKKIKEYNRGNIFYAK